MVLRGVGREAGCVPAQLSTLLVAEATVAETRPAPGAAVAQLPTTWKWGWTPGVPPAAREGSVSDISREKKEEREALSPQRLPGLPTAQPPPPLPARTSSSEVSGGGGSS